MVSATSNVRTGKYILKDKFPRRFHMLYSVDKAVGLARDLSDRLNLRLNNQTGSTALNSVRQSQDEWGYPIIVVSHAGVETESNPVIWIRLSNLFEQRLVGGVETSPAGAPIDIFGNATLPFSPTVAQVAYELNGAGAPIPSTSDYSTCLFEIARIGTVVQQFAIANGTAVTEAAVTAQLNAGTGPLSELKDIDWGYKGNA